MKSNAIIDIHVYIIKSKYNNMVVFNNGTSQQVV